MLDFSNQRTGTYKAVCTYSHNPNYKKVIRAREVRILKFRQWTWWINLTKEMILICTSGFEVTSLPLCQTIKPNRLLLKKKIK